jgi:hypothetical protein
MIIGITINLTVSSIWSNGINQNAIYLANVLAAAGHSVILIFSDSNSKNKNSINTLKKIIKGNDNITAMDIVSSFNLRFDVLIQLGISIEKIWMNAYKKHNSNIKTINYECGNHFLIDSEKILYNHLGGDKPPKREAVIIKPDQIWVIPQMENTNLHYYQHRRDCNKATVIPFVWDSMALEENAKSNNFKTYTKRDINNVAVMEPNISIMKNCIYPIVILEKFVKYEKGELKKIMLIGADKIKNNYTFKKLIKDTEVFKKGLLSAESRFQTHMVLEKHVDMVLSWQIENPLNYLYFDVCWLGWPLVHNANLCKDLGYYYEGFDADGAVDAIKNVIANHNNDEDYMDRMRKIISRYTIENKKMLDNYNRLLDDLVNDRFKRWSYDWKTNTIS